VGGDDTPGDAAFHGHVIGLRAEDGVSPEKPYTAR
jgi:hypothetical protein